MKTSVSFPRMTFSSLISSASRSRRSLGTLFLGLGLVVMERTLLNPNVFVLYVILLAQTLKKKKRLFDPALSFMRAPTTNRYSKVQQATDLELLPTCRVS